MCFQWKLLLFGHVNGYGVDDLVDSMISNEPFHQPSSMVHGPIWSSSLCNNPSKNIMVPMGNSFQDTYSLAHLQKVDLIKNGKKLKLVGICCGYFSPTKATLLGNCEFASEHMVALQFVQVNFFRMKPGK